MVPSPRLIILVLAAVPIFLGGAIYGPLAAVGLIYAAALGLYALIDLLLLPRRRSIVIRRLAPSRVSLASPTPVRFEIENNTRRRLTLLLAEDLPAVMRTDPDPCRTIIAAGGRATVEYRLTARKRGRYRLDRVDVRALPAGGLFYRQFALHLPAEKVLLVGDLYESARYPEIDIEARGDPSGWFEGMAEVIEAVPLLMPSIARNQPKEGTTLAEGVAVVSSRDVPSNLQNMKDLLEDCRKLRREITRSVQVGRSLERFLSMPSLYPYRSYGNLDSFARRLYAALGGTL